MCGITSLLSLDGQSEPDRAALADMTRALSHRGPDDEGYAFLGPAALGHRRLSIIDLAGGHQPIFNEDRSIAIVFNGEIYNYRELQAGLERRGHRFTTRSDTEAIVHLYEEEGPDCVKRLNGMFAFVIWDAPRRRLFCARDRMGQKPLYYAVSGGMLAIASELKALLRLPSLPRRIDRGAFSAYLALEYVPSPRCIFEGVAKLEAGHRLEVSLDSPPASTADIRQDRYWDIPFDPREATEEELSAELRANLRRSVERRLIADVPLGVFLSGGIDSSAIVAAMAELRPANGIKTFTVGFEEKSFDESSYAREVAALFGVEHHEERLAARDVLDILPEISGIMDEPFADPSALPTYLLCRFTRRHVTVALGGDGGDELFAGYDPFQAHHPSRWAERLPRPALTALRAVADCLPTSRRNISVDFRIKRFLAGLDHPLHRRHFAWLGSFPPQAQRSLLTVHALDGLDPDVAFAAVDRHWRQAPAGDDLARTIYQYCKLYLQDDILVKMDRTSMAHGLEARAPMLDYEFVEWAGTVPSRLKLNGFTKKHILKRAMGGVLPRRIVHRRKKGFGMPIGDWLRGPLRGHMLDRLGEKSLAETGLIEPAAARRLMDDHLQGRRDNRKEIWTLLTFVEWHKRFGPGAAP